jgi:hypothetical protein
LRSRSQLLVWAVAVLELAVVADVAATEPTDGTFSVALALLLAPVAVWAVAGIGARVAGPGFALGAAIAYAVLPFAARHYFYGSLLQVYDRSVLPELVGVRGTGWFALGVALAVGVRALPERLAGAAGLVAALVAAALWVNTNWTVVYGNFHESTWSPTLLCLLPFACVLGAGLRSPWVGTALGGWLAFFVLRGVHRPYTGGGFWVALAAAMPAAAVLIASLGLLLPRLRRSAVPAAPAADAR